MRELKAVIADEVGTERRRVRDAAQRARLEVIDEAPRAIDVIALVERCQPDVLLIDPAFSDFAGLELIRHVRRETRTCPIVVARAESCDAIGSAIDAGARAYLAKRDVDELPAIIEAAISGERILGSALVARILEVGRTRPRAETVHFEGLCGKDTLLDVATMLACGKLTNLEIASHLRQPVRTIEGRVARILEDGGFAMRADAEFASRQRLRTLERDHVA